MFCLEKLHVCYAVSSPLRINQGCRSHLPYNRPFSRPSMCAPRQLASRRIRARFALLNARARDVKCPFWRRRFTDAIDFIAARHKSLALPLLTAQSAHASAHACRPKRENTSLQHRVQAISDDFCVRQYYVTGRLSAELYSDDCLFDGPDPDVPVTGLAKYTDATSNLFYRPLSRVDLLHIEVIRGYENAEVLASNAAPHANEVDTMVQIRAHWRLEGALNLPWRPKIKPYTGSTTYTFNDRGLVVAHVEEWSISALDAFASTLFPSIRLGAPPAPPADVLRARNLADGTPFGDRALDSFTRCN
jgi:Uncharacterized conserved protein (DUF2358)